MSGVIEIVLFVFMCGCMFNDVFIIFDEVQNIIGEQMKMFLICMGFFFKVVVIGDVIQIDLLCYVIFGFVVVKWVLSQIEGIGWYEFIEVDVVCYLLVGCIIKVYDVVEQVEEDCCVVCWGELVSIFEYEYD